MDNGSQHLIKTTTATATIAPKCTRGLGGNDFKFLKEINKFLLKIHITKVTNSMLLLLNIFFPLGIMVAITVTLMATTLGLVVLHMPRGLFGILQLTTTHLLKVLRWPSKVFYSVSFY